MDAEQFTFGRAYNVGEPWDSPGNLKLAERAGTMFACPNSQSSPPRYTNYVVVIDHGVSTLDQAGAIPKGSPGEARQILLIEYPNSDIPWTEPRDLDVAELPKLSEGADPGGLGVLFADGTFRRMPREAVLKLFGR